MADWGDFASQNQKKPSLSTGLFSTIVKLDLHNVLGLFSLRSWSDIKFNRLSLGQ